jgi:hypothetical protein
MPRDIFPILGITAYSLSFIAMAFFWRYAAKRSKFKILCFIYWLWVSILLLMPMGFDFNAMVFDPGLLGGFWDAPSIVTTVFMIFVLSHFSLGTSLPTAISETLAKDKDTEFSWWTYLWSVTGSSAIFSLFGSVRYLQSNESTRVSFIMLCVGMVAALIFFIICLPLPLIQKQKNQRMDPWS